MGDRDFLGKTTKTDKSNWWGPIHGTINDHEVTVDVGKPGTPVADHTLITDGHVTQQELDNRHDHFSPDSKAGDRGDRGNSNVPNT